jgi:hypothetical protein
VTLASFQRALTDLIASPKLVRRVWDEPGSALAGYDLTPRERARLEAVARQRGMETSCALYRMNRVTPLYTYLRLTCQALQGALRDELDRFWELQPADAQFEREVMHFETYLRDRVCAGELPVLVEEVLDLELAVNALRYGHAGSGRSPVAEDAPALRDGARVVRLSREPLALLSALDAETPLEELPEGEHYVLVMRGVDDLEVLPVAAELGEPLFAISRDEASSVSEETVEMLLDTGLVVQPTGRA